MRNLFKLKSSKEGGKAKGKKAALVVLTKERIDIAPFDDFELDEFQLVTSPSKGEYCENDEELGYC